MGLGGGGFYHLRHGGIKAGAGLGGKVAVAAALAHLDKPCGSGFGIGKTCRAQPFGQPESRVGGIFPAFCQGAFGLCIRAAAAEDAAELLCGVFAVLGKAA